MVFSCISHILYCFTPKHISPQYELILTASEAKETLLRVTGNPSSWKDTLIRFTNAEARIHPQTIEFFNQTRRIFGTIVLGLGLKHIGLHGNLSQKPLTEETQAHILEACQKSIGLFNRQILRSIADSLYDATEVLVEQKFDVYALREKIYRKANLERSSSGQYLLFPNGNREIIWGKLLQLLPHIQVSTSRALRCGYLSINEVLDIITLTRKIMLDEQFSSLLVEASPHQVILGRKFLSVLALSMLIHGVTPISLSRGAAPTHPEFIPKRKLNAQPVTELCDDISLIRPEDQELIKNHNESLVDISLLAFT